MKVVHAADIFIGTEDERMALPSVPRDGTLFLETDSGSIYAASFSQWIGTLIGGNTMIHVDTAVVGNDNGTPTTLMEYTVPTDTLGEDGDAIEIVIGVNYASNTNLKQFTVSVDETVLYTTGAAAQDGGALMLTIRITRMSSTKALITYGVPTSMALISDSAGQKEQSITMSSPFDISCEGTGGADDDIIQRLLSVEIKRAPL